MTVFFIARKYRVQNGKSSTGTRVVFYYKMYVFVVFILLILNISKLVKSQSVDNGCWPWNVVVYDLDTAFGMVIYICFHILKFSNKQKKCTYIVYVKQQ